MAQVKQKKKGYPQVYDILVFINKGNAACRGRTNFIMLILWSMQWYMTLRALFSQHETDLEINCLPRGY